MKKKSVWQWLVGLISIGAVGMVWGSVMEWEYGYDSNGRLVRVDGGVNRIRYEYSAADNLTGFRQILDTTGNGLPDEWEIAHFGSLGLTDGSQDSDGDGMTDYEEWIAGTNPLDDASYLRVVKAEGGTNGYRVSWGSEPQRMYRLERGTNLMMNPAFLPLQNDLLATPPINMWLDGTATNSSVYFYRIITLEK